MGHVPIHELLTQSEWASVHPSGTEAAAEEMRRTSLTAEALTRYLCSRYNYLVSLDPDSTEYWDNLHTLPIIRDGIEKYGTQKRS